MFGKLFKKLIKLLLILLLLPYLIVPLYIIIPPLSVPIAASYITLQPTHWNWVSYRRFSGALPRAVITAEDGKFCSHHGVDWDSLQQVVKRAEKGKFNRGGSTLAMQTAKNLFLWYMPKFMRKPFEIPLAMWIDLLWSKKREMEVYLNIAQFGKGIYGAEAASRYYFKKPASELNNDEAALLAAALPNPVKRNPSHPSTYTRFYSASIKSRMGGAYAACIK